MTPDELDNIEAMARGGLLPGTETTFTRVIDHARELEARIQELEQALEPFIDDVLVAGTPAGLEASRVLRKGQE